MTEIRVLSYDDVRRLLDVDAMLDALERAFVDLSAGRANVPPRIAARTEGGMLGAMPGALPGVALEVKIVTVFPANHERGIPSHQGLIALFDEKDGTPVALMDAVHITAMRTAGGAAVSARALARTGASVLAILGAGAQGHSHLEVMPRAVSFTSIRIASRNRDHASALAALDERAVACDTFEEAVRGADVVACCTDARSPIIGFGWLSPGTHVTAVGGTFGPELDQQTIKSCRIFVESRDAAVAPPPAGTHELQGIDPATLTEVGEVLALTKAGRLDDEEITIYKSMGHAVEDAAAARIVYDAAVAANVGTLVTI